MTHNALMCVQSIFRVFKVPITAEALLCTLECVCRRTSIIMIMSVLCACEHLERNICGRLCASLKCLFVLVSLHYIRL